MLNKGTMSNLRPSARGKSRSNRKPIPGQNTSRVTSLEAKVLRAFNDSFMWMNQILNTLKWSVEKIFSTKYRLVKSKDTIYFESH
jgi:hypothetical protein